MLDPDKILAGIPAGLRDPLLESYKEIGRNYMERKWGPSELDGGKFSKVVYSIIDGSINGKFPAKPSKPSNMVKACRDLEGLPASTTRIGDRSLRILIPRMLLGMYEIRNNRNVGHVGGDVDPNFMDATAVYAMASWVLAELVRIFHSVSTDEAQTVVNELVEQKHPLIWEVDGIRRVLDPDMNKTDQTLVLLYSKPGWVSEKDLFKWVEYSKLTTFRQHVLSLLHDKRLIEYDQEQGRATLSRLGSEDVERRILKTRI